MPYVGFPNGLGISMEKLIEWLPWAISRPNRCHYSIYHEELGFCGETFYNLDTVHGTAALDIKLLPQAQGKGIAEFALRFAIEQAFLQGNAKRVYVDPHPDNLSAWNLYRKLGFTSKTRPRHLEHWVSYLEITQEDWENSRSNDGTKISLHSS